ncbi:MAG TPA: hypothetical protein VF656_12845 [Pyrinomonadaceae bacterium]|jgi:hypothetical protein
MLPTRNTPLLAALLACVWSLWHGDLTALRASRDTTQTTASARAQTRPLPVRINKLPPTAFPALPRRIVRELVRRGCTIPQVTVEGLEMKEPHNVVSGEFAREGQKDWAVLCSRRGLSAIHIFWGRPTRCASIIGAETDNAERFIGTADSKYILSHYESYGGTTPPPPPHHLGINDGYAESASQVHYCHHGKWLLLQGAD